MNTGLITHPDTLLHMMDGSHPESPARISAIREELRLRKLEPKLSIFESPAATDAQLQRVHTAAYVQEIKRLSPKAGLVRLDQDTAMGPMSLKATLHASGAVVLATDLVMSKKIRNAFCCIRPPGHHAHKARAAGFCIFNHVAVGVAHALAEHKLNRVAIIDFDVHHGDGTQDIFQDDPRVMLCSTFQHPFYPGTGAESRSTRMVNIPLSAGADGKAIRQAFQDDFYPALQQFKPEMIFVSAGFDAHRDDPLAQLKLTKEDYAWMTTFIMQFAGEHAQNRVVSSLEGGYHLPALAESAAAHIETLMA
jgi:acetoin utilization deacetylase AcuC-like enzyme